MVAHDFVAVRSVELHGDHVAHGARGHKQGGFLTDNFSRALLQAIDGGIFAIDVVADFGFGHCPAHGRGWTCDGITAEVDDAHRTGAPMNSANTSLDSRIPRGVRRTRPPLRSRRPSLMKRSRTPVNGASRPSIP